jgi:protein ImuA
MPGNAAHLLSRHTHRRRAGGGVGFLGDLVLERARVHEFCGPARRRLALKVAGAVMGPALWIRPAWVPGRLNPDGIHALIDPSRLIFVTPKRPEDLLWTMEEGLRAGLLSLVVADLPDPPGLTSVRRLHLAGETGAAEGQLSPLGLILTPGAGGAPGVETRWSLSPSHGPGGGETWRLDRLRARTLPVRHWSVTADKAGMHLADPAPNDTPQETPTT